ncbi:DNA-directed RNA polymerase I subunit RPA1-like isoform X2 [Apostichopus japonicus]
MALLGPPNIQPFKVAFRNYTSDEIKKLSVKEITHSQFFTEIGTPVPGGLYDSALGPSEKNDVCSTCLLNPLHCPGHLGHITLPLPVFNPLYIRIMVQILHGSCLKCHHLAAPRWALHNFLCKLKLINSGNMDLLDNLDPDIFKLKGGPTPEKDGMAIDIEEELDEVLTTTLGISLDKIQTHSVGSNNRCMAAHRNQLIDEFAREHISKRGKKCKRCTGNLHAVKLEHNVRLLTKRADGSGKLSNVSISVQEARDHLRKIYQNDKHYLSKLYGMLDKPKDNDDMESSPMDQFFIELLPVIPSRFRPVSGGADSNFSNAESLGLAHIIQTCNTLREIARAVKKSNSGTTTGTVNENNNIQGGGESTLAEKLQRTWYELQTAINCTVDSDLDKLNRFNQKKGVKQTLERKEGIFRKFMMGKRVNYAARSVISPDPYINSDQIGIPDIIAKKLTYPEPVTNHNIHELRQAVKNGPDVHPGAVAVEEGHGKIRRLNPSNQTSRDAMANRLMAPSDVSDMPTPKKVHRHIRNGDIVLLNRQPTLHKPSIMAHKVRILSGEKTLRLHYSACKTYNADFDGDEMNVHFPQNEMGRAEATMIANTSEQYLVPKDGTPLGGLIQDHMIAGLHMTVRGRFFTWSQYQQLVFAALTDKSCEIQLLPPSMIKPALLWSGKQVVSTVLLNIIPKHKQLLNFVGKTKVKDKSWLTTSPRKCEVGGTTIGNEMTEAEVIIRQGELLCGVLDKENYGPTPYGMVHCCYELYGGQVGVALLSSLGRLFTAFLQQIAGFSMGIKDIIVLPEADKKRQALIKNASKLGAEATARALDVGDEENREEMADAFEAAHRGTSNKEIKDIDMEIKGTTDKLSEDVRSVCLPKGLLMKFPGNSLQTMILTGAKGSQVNALQISCLLGQIELEGKRPPLMTSGRSLPSFKSYDTSLMAGGYVAGRFLTGIRPQEYFFHCMAGREGLIDTAVKTSRSGYLQRCIVKHLEGLLVNYDLTVRDSDSSIIQFSYGEDGLDISQTPFLKQEFFNFLMENDKVNNYQNVDSKPEGHLSSKKAEKIFKKVRKWRQKRQGHDRYRSGFVDFSEGKMTPLVEEFKQKSPKDSPTQSYRKAKQSLIDSWRACSDKESYEKTYTPCPDPAHCQLRPNQNFGAVSERMNSLIEDYLNEFPERPCSDGEQDWSKDTFKQLIYQKYRKSLCEPGEAVGLLAAQSIGEPSTQMTLNTFHFAGRGEMNVTLGIPRLREILMVASKNIKTPGMTVPVKDNKKAHRRANKLCHRLSKLVLADVLEDVNVWESYLVQKKSSHFVVYKIRLGLLPKEDYKVDVSLEPALVLRLMERKFFAQLRMAIQSKIRDLQSMKVFRAQNLVNNSKKDKSSSGQDEDEGDDNMEDEEEVVEEEADEKEEAEEQDRGSDNYDDDDDDDNEEQKDDDNHDELVGEKQVDDEEEDASKDEDRAEERSSDGESNEQESKQHSTEEDVEAANRIRHVIHSSGLVKSYSYDQKDSLWCEFTFEIEMMDSGKLDVTSIISEVAQQVVMHQAPGIQRCILADDKGKKLLQTEGVNLKELYKYDHILDLFKMYTNDVHAMAHTFGIEAACRVLVKEITDVFNVYGIAVDRRHLSLIADYMTYDGHYKPFSRMGLETNPSTIQKMTFESCMSVLRKATLQGTQDDLQSPSARLVLGRVVSGGTGCFDVLSSMF